MGVPWLSPVPGLPDSLDNDPGQEHANAVIAAALAAGVRHFDTAPLYGMGCSEEVFGAALVAARAHGVDGAAEAQVYTKVGRLIRDNHWCCAAFDKAAPGTYRDIPVPWPGTLPSACPDGQSPL